jgi:putative transposase
LNVSRSAYYTWLKGTETIYETRDQQLQPLVRNIFHQHRRRYGARRIAKELNATGESCSRTKARKIMEKMDLIAIQPKSFKPRTTNSQHKLGYNPNLLLQGITVERINQIWVGDITYISLPNAFAYMAALMDLYSRKIIGWSIDTNMAEPLVIEALNLAIKARQPAKGLIHHTDRGGQYAGKKYRKILQRAGMQQSMSRAADCYDNAFMESYFGTIKTELEMTTYPSIQHATQEIKEYLNYYNVIRRHSSLDYLSPTCFEISLDR